MADWGQQGNKGIYNLKAKQAAAAATTTVWLSKKTGGKKIRIKTNLEFALVIDEQILWFEIAMQDTPPVTVGKSSQKLIEEDLHNKEK